MPCDVPVWSHLSERSGKLIIQFMWHQIEYICNPPLEGCPVCGSLQDDVFTRVPLSPSQPYVWAIQHQLPCTEIDLDGQYLSCERWIRDGRTNHPEVLTFTVQKENIVHICVHTIFHGHFMHTNVPSFAASGFTLAVILSFY